MPSAQSFATYFLGVHELSVWALWHIAIHAAGMALCAAALWPLGRPKWRVLFDELRLGAHFCSSYFFSSLPQNVDRLVLSVVATPPALASYSLASRITNTSYLTVNGFMRLRYRALAIASREGPSSVNMLALSYLPAMLCLGLATSLGLYLIAPALPIVFGNDYGSMVSYLQIACWLVAINAVSSIPYDALGASARHALRARIVNTGGVLSVLLLILLGYYFGVIGVIVAQYAGQIGISCAIWMALFQSISRSAGSKSATKETHDIGIQNPPIGCSR